MSATDTIIKPGDPPPFWEGLWHPEGKSEGAVMVKPMMGGVRETATVTIPAASAGQPVAAPAAPAQVAMPTATSSVPPPAPVEPPPAPAQPAATTPEPASARVINLGPAPTPPPAPAAPAAAPAQPAGAPARSFVMSLVAQGPLAPAPGLPTLADPAASEALRAKAKELQAANQLGPALQALGEALKRSPGEAATYALMGQVLLAGRAWEDAAHHFLIAYMLAPREAAYGRMTLNAAFVLGYVGWAFQIAQALYKTTPTPDLAEMGRTAQGWLQTRPAALTQLCPGCRATTIVGAPGPCAKCGAAPMGAAANAIGFSGLKLLQQGSASGRLFAGARCISCQQDTVLIVNKGGPACSACHGPALAAL